MSMAEMARRLLDGELPNAALMGSGPDASRIAGRDLGSAIASTATALRETFALDAGDRVLLRAGNSVEQAVTALAVMAAGAILVPVSPDAARDDLDWIVKSCDPRGCVHEGTEGAVGVPGVGLAELTGAGRMEAPGRGGDPGDVAAIIYTSGSTARPKGVRLTHGNLAANARSLTRHLGLNSDDVHLCVLPMYHSNALHFSLITALLTGGTVVIAPALPLRGCADLVRAHGVTRISAAPQALRLLMRDPRFHASRIPSLRTIVTASAPLSRSLCESFTTATGIRPVQGYGLTECTNFATMTPPDPSPETHDAVMLAQQVPSAGHSLDDTTVTIEAPRGIDLADATGADIPAGVGEVVIRGPQVSPGYWGGEDLGGVLRTGDLGYLRTIGEHEFLFLVGRVKEMAIRNGENHSLRHIDDDLAPHMGDLDYAAVGVPDEQVGDEIALCVRGGAEIAERVVAAIRKVPVIRRPRLLFLVDEAIPRTATGKIKRARLQRAMAERGDVIDLRRPTSEGRTG